MNILKLFISGHERSLRAKKNILGSFILRGINIITGFIMVPLVLNYLDQTRYGIWLTIASFLTWFSFFEIGLGSGMRNKLADAIAKRKYKLARIYVSTTYGMLTFIIIVVSALFFLVNPFIDWTRILNTGYDLKNELTSLTFIVFGFFFLRFVLRIIGTILMALQRPAINDLFMPISNLIVLLIIYILTKFTKGSLIYIGFVLSSVPVIILFIASLIFFNGKYKFLKPSIYYIKLNFASDLLNLGVKFFLIQISGLILFQTSNIIIAQNFGPAEVTPYNIAYKYFALINMLFTIIVTPFWSAYTEAWAKGEISWIKNTIKILLRVWFAFVLIAILMLIFSNWFFDLWIGKKNMDEISIPNSLSVLLALHFVIFTFGGVYNMFINGLGKIKLQTYSLLLGAVFFIPLSLIFIKIFKLGIESVILATIIANIYSPLIAPIQYYKLINNKARGIWNK